MSIQSIKLQLINHSNDANNSRIVIFQKNTKPGYSELSVAWKVIYNLGQGDRHPFEFPLELEVDANDAWGNFTPRFPASPGDAYQMVLDSSGDVLKSYRPGSADIRDIDVRNDLLQGSIGANCYRDGRLLATKTNVAPGQKAVFVFKPTVYIGVASQVEEGEIMDSAVISSVNTELALLGVQSADILMRGGGPGPDSTPFQFSLENVRFA
jgi:hypothetical protein